MGNFRKVLGWAAGALLGAATFTVSETSRADAREVLRPSTRTAWWAGMFGPGFGVTGCGRGGCIGPASAGGFFGTQFQFNNEVGVHLGTGAGHGPAIGGILILGFGGAGFGLATRFSPQFKFWYDIPIKKEYAIYLTPGVSAGYSGYYGAFGTAVHFFATQATFAGRLVIKDRGIVFFQPVTLDIQANGLGAFISFNIIAGGGVTFP
jgi:hypothetical protein